MEQNLAVNEELRSFLRMRGESYGMWEPKLTNWVAGMSNEQKPKELLNSIQSELSVSPNEACLDLGCGFGNLVIALSERFESVSGIELNPERVEWSKRRCPSAEIVCGTAEKLPWPDNNFGLVMSTDVFEHLDHSQQIAAAREVARVLKPGGRAFITVASKFQIRDEHNYVLFGTWMPNRLRKFFSMRMHDTYLQCWEHSGAGWSRIFKNAGLLVQTVPQKSKMLKISTSRFHLFVQKPPSTR